MGTGRGEVQDGRRWLLARAAMAGGLLLLVAVAGWALLRPEAPATAPVAADPAPAPALREAPPPPPPPAARVPADQPRAAAGRPSAQESPDMPKELRIEDLGAGDGTGIHAFPKPGTKAVKVGLIVPEGFELPPGYVRHYQTADDGTQLPPILVFHPDYQPVDARGNPIELPWDRVVPPELAPRGMPQVWLDPPPPPGSPK